MDKKLSGQLALTDMLISNTQLAIECVKRSPLYEFVLIDNDREKELSRLYQTLKELYIQKHTYLENIKRSIDIELQIVSQKEREVSLLKN